MIRNRWCNAIRSAAVTEGLSLPSAGLTAAVQQLAAWTAVQQPQMRRREQQLDSLLAQLSSTDVTPASMVSRIRRLLAAQAAAQGEWESHEAALAAVRKRRGQLYHDVCAAEAESPEAEALWIELQVEVSCRITLCLELHFCLVSQCKHQCTPRPLHPTADCTQQTCVVLAESASESGICMHFPQCARAIEMQQEVSRLFERWLAATHALRQVLAGLDIPSTPGSAPHQPVF